MIRFFYSLLVYFLLPFTVIKLIYRGFKQPDYLQHWAERYGFYSLSTKKLWGKRKTLWIHAVSVGETKAAIPFIKSSRMAHRRDARLPLILNMLG